jgi:hypothetical protein
VSTANLQPGAVGGWIVDSNAIYSGTKSASGSYASTGSITIGSSPNGYISANKFRIDANGDAFFTGSITGATGTFSGSLSGATITGGTITIGSGSTIFKADSQGIYLGNASFGSAPFSVSAGGALIATGASISGVLTAGVDSTIGGWTADSNRLYKEVGENVISLRASDSPDTAPAIEIFAGDSNNYNECRILGYGILFENYDDPNTLNAVYQYSGVALDDSSNDRSISLTASGLSVFGTGGTFVSVSTSGITAVGPIGTLGTLSGARGGFTYTGAEGTIEVRRSKAFSNLASSQRFMTFINTDNSTPVAEIAFNTGGTGATFNNLSDRDYKNILDEQIDGIDIIKKIKPVVFTWKNHESSEKNYGFVAQDLYDIIPHAVSKGGDLDSVTNSSRPWMVSTPEIIPYLVKAIQELSQKIEDFESRFA